MGKEGGCGAQRKRRAIPCAPWFVTEEARVDEDDRRYMARALALAAAVSHTSPNPKVGAVVVRDDKIIGEGAHLGAGQAHAETLALEGIDARAATLYVTLEPCAHRGATPPCAPAVVEAGVGRVVVAMQDPDGRVAGRGIEQLRSAGVRVDIGLHAREAAELNAAYLHQRVTGKPLVTLKLALSLDGHMAAPDGSSRWITGEASRARVHARRAQVDAVMVGAGTVVSDDPKLTDRRDGASRQPARVIVDSSGRVSAASAAFDAAEVIVATSDRSSHDAHIRWKEAGAEVHVLPSGEGGVDLSSLVDELSRRGWLEIYCEGGPTLATSLLRAGVVDRLELYYGPLLVGRGPGLGDLGVTTMGAARRWKLISAAPAGDDFCVILAPARVEGDGG